MGRLTTRVAAAAVNANNLPSVEQLPKISLVDALLPRYSSTLTSSARNDDKVLEAGGNQPSERARHGEVRRDRNGRLLLINHRTKLPQNIQDGENVECEKTKAEAGRGRVQPIAGRPQTRKRVIKGNEDPGDVASQKEHGKTFLRDDPKKTDNPNAPPIRDFTSDDDALLRALKVSGKTWREIAREMKRPQNTLKARYKQIEKSEPDVVESLDEHPSKSKKDKGLAEGSMSKAEGSGEPKQYKKFDTGSRPTNGARDCTVKPAIASRDTNTYMNQAREDVVQKISTAARPLLASSSTRSQVKFTPSDWHALQEDGMFSSDELELLSDIIMRGQAHNIDWLHVASIFWDKTGRRVHSYDIQGKFAELMNL